MTLSPGARLGPYEILALLGAGGMGEVYRARDSRLGRTVAIKILPQNVIDNPARRQRFEREARAASRLSHPHICALYDIGEHDRIHFIVMEFLEGETLAERLRRGPLPLNQILRHAIEVADALHHAHRAGIVHRDLKPANVMLTPAGAKLLDFGVARLSEADAVDATGEALQITETESLTNAGMILGTLQYMSPEQLEGKEADARTDIFSLGAVVYEMATARPAFTGASKASLIAAILEHDPPSLSSSVGGAGFRPGTEGLVPSTLDHVVSRCLAKDPDERWQTAADVRQELRWIAEGSLQKTVLARNPAGRRLRQRVARVAAVCLAVAAAAYLAAREGWILFEQAQPTFKQITFRRGLVTDARFAPDGRIVYSAAWNGGPMQLYETRGRGPESQSLDVPSAGLASVSSSGEFALLLGCKLEFGWCVGTLARKPSSGGAPRPLLENVVNADWSPDGTLAVIHQADGDYRLEFPIGKTLYRTQTGRLTSLRFAPDGRRLAFMEYPTLDEEIGMLKVVDLEGKVSTISSGWKTIRGLQWSPNGREIWFTASRSGKSCSLYAATLSGSVRLIFHAPGDVTIADVARDGRVLLFYGPTRARMIWSGEGKQRELSWFDWPTVADISTDGQTVLFHEWGEGVGASPAVYTRRVDAPDAVQLGPGRALALSPDGRRALALVESSEVEAGQRRDGPKLVLYATGAGEKRVLPTEGIVDVLWARWFPDSRRVLLATLVNEGGQTFIQDVEDGRLQRVASSGTLGILVDPDGRRILARDPPGTYSLWPLDGEAPTPVAGLGPEDRPFQWSADGRFVYVQGDAQDVLRVDRYMLATGRRERWREIAPPDSTGLIGLGTGRGELAMTPDGQNAAFTYWTWIGDLFLVEGIR